MRWTRLVCLALSAGATLGKGAGRHEVSGGESVPRPEAAVGSDPVCRNPGATPEKSVETKRRPNYFFRPFPISDIGSYAGPNENWILDFASKKEIEMAGSYDPVPTPDELFMTIPTDGAAVKGLTFFAMSDVLRDGKDAKPVPILTEGGRTDADLQMKGVYQSIGKLAGSEPGAPSYRVITDMASDIGGGKKSALSYQDYKIVRSPAHGDAVQPLHAKPKPLCTNFTRTQLATPMLSKDGLQLAALDVEEQVTKIFWIEPDGSCREKLNLGMATGKVDFDFSGENIVFHKYNHELKKGKSRYVPVPSDNFVANVYTYNLDSKTLKKITHNTDSNSVYPAFRKDGKIVFIDHPHGAKDDATNSKKSRLVMVDPNKARGQTFDFMKKASYLSDGQSRRLHAMVTLGSLWAELCSPAASEASAETAALNTLSIKDEKSCNALVSRHWDKFEKKIKGNKVLQEDSRIKADLMGAVTKEDLEAACEGARFKDRAPAASPLPKPIETPSSRTVPGPDPTAVARAMKSCASCHNTGQASTPQFDISNRAELLRARPDGRTLRDEVLRRLLLPPGDRERMPTGTLTDADRAALVQHLRSL